MWEDRTVIRAAVFDLDGLLVDSEPLWRRAEIEVLTPLGVPLTEEMCRQTQGTRVDRAITHWFERFPWDGPAVAEVADAVVERVVDLIRTEGEAMPGAREAVELFSGMVMPIAVCSSSWPTLVDVALERVGLTDLIAVRHSAEDEEYGKPHPACYLTTAAKLGVEPSECLAFEDSFHGAIAAKAALMGVVAVPEPLLRDPRRWGFCDAVLDSLVELDADFVKRIGA